VVPDCRSEQKLRDSTMIGHGASANKVLESNMVKVPSEVKFRWSRFALRHEIAVIEIEKTLCRSGT
jgi:hypothetical protein